MQTFYYKNTTSPYSVRINPLVESDLHIFDDKNFSIPAELGRYIGKQPASQKIALIKLLRSLYAEKNEITGQMENNLGLWQAKVIVEKYQAEKAKEISYAPLAQAFQDAK